MGILSALLGEEGTKSLAANPLFGGLLTPGPTGLSNINAIGTALLDFALPGAGKALMKNRALAAQQALGAIPQTMEDLQALARPGAPHGPQTAQAHTMAQEHQAAQPAAPAQAAPAAVGQPKQDAQAGGFTPERRALAIQLLNDPRTPEWQKTLILERYVPKERWNDVALPSGVKGRRNSLTNRIEIYEKPEIGAAAGWETIDGVRIRKK